MGMFDALTQAAGALLGGKDAGIQGQLLQAATQLLGKDSGIGGLAGLVQSFQKNGMADIVNSWVGKGENLPISPAQVQQGLGGGLLEQLAKQAGLSTDAASHQLSSLLPSLVDKLTPDGHIPESNILEQGLNLLRGKLG
ncbi:MAG: YidB family protein [Nitrospiraceae bacterium]